MPWRSIAGMGDERYQPASGFLIALLNEELSVTHGPFAEGHLQTLIALTADPDEANRDWACMLLAQSGADRPEVRAAFVRATTDPHRDTRHEAMIGLARLDREGALPIVGAELERQAVTGTYWSLAFEAAAEVADAGLVSPLRAIRDALPDDDDWFDRSLRTAIEACERGVPPER